MTPAKKRATYADVLATPDHLVAEVLFGVLHAHPRPARKHTLAASHLGVMLGGPFGLGDQPGGWVLLDEPELHLGDDIVVPDLAGWRRERMPAIDDSAFFDLAPDWICEVLSPRTEAVDRDDKMRIYAREDVAHAWLLDPVACTLEVFRLQKRRAPKRKRRTREWVLAGVYRDDATVRAVPFDAIALSLGALWA